MHALTELFSEEIDPQTSWTCIRAGGMVVASPDSSSDIQRWLSLAVVSQAASHLLAAALASAGKLAKGAKQAMVC